MKIKWNKIAEAAAAVIVIAMVVLLALVGMTPKGSMRRECDK